jgi:peptidoglycan/LPS O-acetylase OafA/YrhL
MVSILSALNDLPSRLRRVTNAGTYVPQIDGLRFLAIIPVLFWHSGLRGFRNYDQAATPSGAETLVMQWLPHGHVGVDLFFFISGYIIAFPFLSGHPPRIGKFFGRRLLRIEPPYFLVLIGCFLLLALSGYAPSHAPSFHRTDAPLWQSLAASLVYAHGMIFNAPPRLNPPAWSLEVEVQFYLISPIILGLLLKLKHRIRRVAILLATIAAWLGSSAILGADLESVHRWTLLGHAWPFLLGMLICDFATEASPFAKPTRWVFDVTFLLGLVCMAASGHYEERVHGFLEHALRDGVRALCILAIYYGAARGTIGRRVTGAPWIALIGGACYSIYLTHVPLMQVISEVVFRLVQPTSLLQAWAIAFGVLIPVAIAAGLVFYALIERPCTFPDWPQRLVRMLRRPRNDAPSLASELDGPSAAHLAPQRKSET